MVRPFMFDALCQLAHPPEHSLVESICVCVCVSMCVCMCVCVYVCMCVYVYIHVCMYIILQQQKGPGKFSRESNPGRGVISSFFHSYRGNLNHVCVCILYFRSCVRRQCGNLHNICVYSTVVLVLVVVVVVVVVVAVAVVVILPYTPLRCYRGNANE